MGADIIDRNVRLGKGNDVAVYWENAKGDTKTLTYGQLERETNKFGNALRGLGLGKGDRILFRTPNIAEFIIGFLGALKIGAVPIPSSTLFKEKEVEYRINDSGAVAAFSTPEYVSTVEKVLANCHTLKHIIVVGEASEQQISYEAIMEEAYHECKIEKTHSEDTSFMMYTSGTTGNPKAAVHAHRYVRGHEPNAIFWAAYHEGDVVSHIGELNWIFTLLNNFLLPLHHGCPIVVYQGAGGFDPEKWFQLIDKYGITNFAATPTGYRMLMTVENAKEKYDLSSLRHCISAGEPLPADTYYEWKERFNMDIMDGIGQTECMVFVSNMRGMPIQPGSCGRPQPGFGCRIVDKEGNDVAVGETGQLIVHRDTPGLFKEYWRKPEKTAEVFKGDWYWTGDVLAKSTDGYYWFKGRGDDLIKASGYRISPFEVESSLACHPAVLESAAVESPDEVRGAVVKAFIVLREGYEANDKLIKELQEHVKNDAAPYKYPRKINFVKELPKTQSGKIKRKELRKAEFAKVVQN
jgi:acetyl-CoA synthetase